MSRLDEYADINFKLIKSIKNDEQGVERGRCMRESDKRLNFSERDKGKI